MGGQTAAKRLVRSIAVPQPRSAPGVTKAQLGLQEYGLSLFVKAFWSIGIFTPLSSTKATYILTWDIWILELTRCAVFEILAHLRVSILEIVFLAARLASIFLWWLQLHSCYRPGFALRCLSIPRGTPPSQQRPVTWIHKPSWPQIERSYQETSFHPIALHRGFISCSKSKNAPSRPTHRTRKKARGWGSLLCLFVLLTFASEHHSLGFFTGFTSHEPETDLNNSSLLFSVLLNDKGISRVSIKLDDEHVFKRHARSKYGSKTRPGRMNFLMDSLCNGFQTTSVQGSTR